MDHGGTEKEHDHAVNHYYVAESTFSPHPNPAFSSQGANAAGNLPTSGEHDSHLKEDFNL
jgi:hypothetical protein